MLTLAQKILIGVAVVAALILIVWVVMTPAAPAGSAVTPLPGGVAPGSLPGDAPTGGSTGGTTGGVTGGTTGGTGAVTPAPAPATRTLYSTKITSPDRYIIGWTQSTLSGINKMVKVLTGADSGATQYTVCQSATSPSHSLVRAGSTCPTGWKAGAQFYGYDAAAPGRTPVCFGHAENPLRGKMGVGESNCGLWGWTHDATMYVPI